MSFSSIHSFFPSTFLFRRNEIWNSRGFPDFTFDEAANEKMRKKENMAERKKKKKTLSPLERRRGDESKRKDPRRRIRKKRAKKKSHINIIYRTKWFRLLAKKIRISHPERWWHFAGNIFSLPGTELSNFKPILARTKIFRFFPSLYYFPYYIWKYNVYFFNGTGAPIPNVPKKMSRNLYIVAKFCIVRNENF